LNLSFGVFLFTGIRERGKEGGRERVAKLEIATWLKAVKGDLGSLHDQLKIKVNSNSSRHRFNHTDPTTTATTPLSSGTTGRTKNRRKRDILPAVQVGAEASRRCSGRWGNK
jgi:hypothetical protein